MRLKILFLYLMAVIKLDKPYSLFTLDIRLQFRHPCSARTTSKFFNLADSTARQDAGRATLLQLCRTRSADKTLSFGT